MQSPLAFPKATCYWANTITSMIIVSWSELTVIFVSCVAGLFLFASFILNKRTLVLVRAKLSQRKIVQGSGLYLEGTRVARKKTKENTVWNIERLLRKGEQGSGLSCLEGTWGAGEKTKETSLWNIERLLRKRVQGSGLYLEGTRSWATKKTKDDTLKHWAISKKEGSRISTLLGREAGG